LGWYKAAFLLRVIKAVVNLQYAWNSKRDFAVDDCGGDKKNQHNKGELNQPDIGFSVGGPQPAFELLYLVFKLFSAHGKFACGERILCNLQARKNTSIVPEKYKK
jgi:hypothetical protein